MTQKIDWNGLIPATVLPFGEDGTMDEAGQCRLIDHLADIDGVTALACNGHASDSWSLTRAERDRLTRLHVEASAGRVPIVTGIAAQTERDYIAHMEDAQKSGAAACLVIPPAIFRNVSVQGTDRPYDFFRTITDAVDLPVIIFQHMHFLGNHYSPAQLARLTEIENIVAIKASVGDFRLYEKELIALRNAPRQIAVLASSDVLLFPYMALGHFTGSLISIGSLAPHWMVEMIAAFKANDLDRARAIWERIFPVIDHFYNTPGINNSAFIKEALHMLGVFDKPSFQRAPHPHAFDAAQRREIQTLLDESGLTDMYAGASGKHAA